MSVASEIRAAADMLAERPHEASFHRAVGQLLTHLARTTPDTVIESQAGPLVKFGLDIARAYLDPGRGSAARALQEHLTRDHVVSQAQGLTYEAAAAVHARDHHGGYFVHDEPARLHGKVHGYDQGVPVRTLSGEKSCGCFITDVCDCNGGGS